MLSISHRLLFACLSLALYPCIATAQAIQTSGPAAKHELADEQVLHRGNFLEPETLDPHRARGAEASNILRDLYEGLTREGPAGNILPGVAQSWDIENDGLRYIFHLRESARWSNGDPVTAEDFVAGIQRTINPANGSAYADSLRIIKGAKDILSGEKEPGTLAVTAAGPHELVIELATPAPYLLGMLTHHSMYPIHRASLAEHGERFTRPGNLVGNGAFKLAKWRVNSHIRLQKNEHYWDKDAVRLTEVYYYPIDDEEAEYNRFRAGGLDVTQTIPVRRYAQLREDHPDALRIAPYLSTYYYGFNLSKPPFKDAPGLRRALSMVVNRGIIAEKVMGVGELPAWSLSPPGISNYQAPQLEYADWPMEKRLAEARELYAAAGYSADNPLEVEIRHNTGDNHRRVAIAIATMWRQALGVEATIVNEEWRVFIQTRRQREETEVYRAGWVGDYNDPYTFLQTLMSGNAVNDTTYSNPDYDAAVSRAAAIVDTEARMQAMRDAESILLADHPILPLYVYVSKHLVAPYVGGWQDNVMDHHASRDLYILEH